jgi:hypothetical protein
MEGTKYRQTMVGDEKQNGSVQTKKTKNSISMCREQSTVRVFRMQKQNKKENRG